MVSDNAITTDFFDQEKSGNEKHNEDFGGIVSGIYIDNQYSPKYGNRVLLSIEFEDTFPLTINITPDKWVKDAKGNPKKPGLESTIYAFLQSLHQLGVKTIMDFTTEEIATNPSFVGKYVEFVVEHREMNMRLTGSEKRARLTNTNPDTYAVWRVSKIAPASEAPQAKVSNEVEAFFGNQPNPEVSTAAPAVPKPEAAVQVTMDEVTKDLEQ